MHEPPSFGHTNASVVKVPSFRFVTCIDSTRIRSQRTRRVVKMELADCLGTGNGQAAHRGATSMQFQERNY
eukprot:4415102-Amphidinium_carterae.1